MSQGDQFSPPPPPNAESSVLSTVCQAKSTRCVDQVINNDVSNSSAQHRAVHQPYFNPLAFPSLENSNLPGPIDRHSKGSLKADNRRRTRKKPSGPRSKQSRGMSFILERPMTTTG